MEKIHIFYNYCELPKLVRIQSEALCLDHTFDPASSEKPIGIEECLKLASSPYIDSVKMLLTEANDAYYIEPLANDEKVHLFGWEDAKNYY